MSKPEAEAEAEKERVRALTPEQRAEEKKDQEANCAKPKQEAETQKAYKERVKNCPK